MSPILTAVRAAGLRVGLALAAVCASGAALAQSYFDPYQVPTVMAFRPGSFGELLFLTNPDVGANVVLARHMHDGKLVARTEIKGPFTSAAFFGSDRILTGDKQGAVAVWSLDGRRLATLVATGKPVSNVTASPGGRFVAMRHPKGPIRVVTASGRPVAAIGLGPTGIECEDEFGTGKIVFTPDERVLVSTDNCGKLIVATVEGRSVPIDDRDHIFVSGIALAKDGRTLLLSYFGMPGGGADFRTLGPARVSARRQAPGPFGHADPQAIAAFGDGFVVASRNRLRFIGADGGKTREDVAIDGPQRLAVADKGERLVVHAKEGVVLYAGGNRWVRRPFADFGAPVDTAILPSGVIAALSGYGTLQFWTPDGSLARDAVAAWRHADLENADFGRGSLLVAPGRKVWAALTPLNTLQLFESGGARRGAAIALPAGSHRTIESETVALLDDRLVLIGPDRRTLRILSLEGKPLSSGLAPHPHEISSLAVSPDGARFATLDFRGILRLWSSDGSLIKERRALRGSFRASLVFAPQANAVAMIGEKKIVLWHLDGPDRVEQRPGRFVRFLPDGALVRVEDNALVIDEHDGSERYVQSFREPTVYAVSDDARWAIVSERGVARHVTLDKRQ